MLELREWLQWATFHVPVPTCAHFFTFLNPNNVQLQLAAKKLKKNKTAAIHIYSNFSLILLLFLFQSKALPCNIEKYFGWFLCLSFYPEIYLCKHQNIRMNYFFWYYVQDFLWLVNGLNGQKVVAIEAQFRQFRNMMVNKILLNGNRKNVYFAVRINLPHLFCHVILGFFFPLLKWILFLEEDLAWMVFCVDFRVRWRQHKVQGRKYSMRIQCADKLD